MDESTVKIVFCRIYPIILYNFKILNYLNRFAAFEIASYRTKPVRLVFSVNHFRIFLRFILLYRDLK